MTIRSPRSLLVDPQTGTMKRPQNALFFHRPRRVFSAIRQDDYKLMLFWKTDGTVQRRELFKVNPDPREEGHDIAAKEADKADALQELLLSHLKSVDAEKPKPPRPKRKKKPSRKS